MQGTPVSERAVPVAIFETDPGNNFDQLSFFFLRKRETVVMCLSIFAVCRNSEVLCAEMVQDFIRCWYSLHY